MSTIKETPKLSGAKRKPPKKETNPVKKVINKDKLIAALKTPKAAPKKTSPKKSQAPKKQTKTCSCQK